MKGFLKGLRYISQVFESEKEEEMQIGLPTDVKHVAHIGNDGSSSSNTPSWMNEFKTSTKSASRGSPSRGKMKQSGSSSPSNIQKPRRQKNSNIESSGRKQNSKDPNGSTRPSRKNKKGVSTSEGSTPRSRQITEIHTTNDICRK